MTRDDDVSAAEILALDDARYQAMVDQNWDRFAEISHPDLAYTHASGVTDTLESYLAKARTGFFVYHDIEHPVDFVRIVDDVALVVGELRGRVIAGGTERPLRSRSLAVWKHTPSGWRLLAYQPTPVPA